MAWTLINRGSSDAMTPSATLTCPASTSVTLTIANASVLAQLGHGDGAGTIWDWEPEEFLIPGVHVLEDDDKGIDAVRFRSATPDTPAQVSVTAR